MFRRFIVAMRPQSQSDGFGSDAFGFVVVVRGFAIPALYSRFDSGEGPPIDSCQLHKNEFV